MKNLWQRWFKRPAARVESLPDSVTVDAGVSHRRALEWIGRDRLERQRFYESWAARDSWLVYREALPLLLGYDPEAAGLEHDPGYAEQRQMFWQHLKRCVQQQLPPALLNPSAPPPDWRAAPAELYRWAVAARLPVPEELDALLAFVSSMTQWAVDTARMPPARPDTGAGRDPDSLAREQVLSALLSLSLRAWHRDSGRDAAALRDELLDRLYGNCRRFFGTGQPPLSRPALHDLIDRSLDATESGRH